MAVVRSVVAAALAAGVVSLAGAAFGDDAPAAPDADHAKKPACITDTSGFKMQGKTPVYEMTLQNTCAERVKCRVYLKVDTARGATRGEATLILDGRKQGEPPTKSYALKVKMLSGMAQGARECKVM
ncbi:MAG TPA: hypothetical protein VFW22_08415 [Pseudolabrys sp.]|nr:hypothetical protein [Pseudolabrys sp.]